MQHGAPLETFSRLACQSEMALASAARPAVCWPSLLCVRHHGHGCAGGRFIYKRDLESHNRCQSYRVKRKRRGETGHFVDISTLGDLKGRTRD